MRMEHSENFKAVLEEKTREAESIIAAYLPKEEGFAKELAKAMNYALFAAPRFSHLLSSLPPAFLFCLQCA